MKKKWFAVMMLLVSLLAAGCGRDEMPARAEQATEPSAKTQRQLPQETMADRKTIAAGRTHTVGLKADGTVEVVGSNDSGQCKTNGWTDIIAVEAGMYHTVGLKTDGTVVAAGDSGYDADKVGSWRDIVAISADGLRTVGLRADGTVVAAGSNECGESDIDGWTDIIAVGTGFFHTVGLKSDGTVVTTGSNDNGQCDIGQWTNIIAVEAGYDHTVGLKADGTVVAKGSNKARQCSVNGWSDIIAISAGDNHTVGLKSDGTVVATGWNEYGQCEVGTWTDIVAISAGSKHTVGLKADGTVVTAGDNGRGQCNAGGWKNIRHPISLRAQSDVESEDLSGQYDKLLAEGYSAQGDHYALVAKQKESYNGFEISLGVIKNNSWLVPLTADFPFKDENGLLLITGVIGETLSKDLNHIYSSDYKGDLISVSNGFHYVEDGCFFSAGADTIYNAETQQFYRFSQWDDVYFLGRENDDTYYTYDGKFAVEQSLDTIYGINNICLFDVQTMQPSILIPETDYQLEAPYNEGLLAISSKYGQLLYFYNAQGKKVLDISEYKTYDAEKGFFENGRVSFYVKNELGTMFELTIDTTGALIEERKVS